jgi:phage terminase small subunit
MSLTAKQEHFAQCIADGMTQADAYRTAYGADKMKTETIHKRASELMSDGEVSGRVQELRAKLSAKALWSREKSVEALLNVMGNPDRQTDIIAAVKELNAMHGFNAPQKVDLMNSDGSLTPTVIQIVAKK